MLRSNSKLFIAVLFELLLLSPLIGQTVQVERPASKIWFIARVVNTDPFMLEYVDDWYRHQGSMKGSEYGAGVDVNPQSQLENIKNFELGDIISGEFCTRELFNCGSAVRVSEVSRDLTKDEGMRLEPPVAVNLKKLSDDYKIKYQTKGFLLSYKPHKDNLVHNLTIYRDGTVFLNSYYSGGIRRRLSADELKMLERAFFDNGIDKIPLSKSDEYFRLELATVFGKYRNLLIDYSSSDSKRFTDILDELIATQVRNANYRITYRWRFRIKDWQYEDVLPLDKAADREYKYLVQNWKRLSETIAPKEFFAEAEDRYGHRMHQYLYRFKGRLYYFSFPICTDRRTGSWACFRAAEVGVAVGEGKLGPGYEEWPRNLRTRLRAIPQDALMTQHDRYGKGMEIHKDDLEKHRDFYSQFLRSGKTYQEGEYVYADLKVWFH